MNEPTVRLRLGFVARLLTVTKGPSEEARRFRTLAESSDSLDDPGLPETTRSVIEDLRRGVEPDVIAACRAALPPAFLDLFRVRGLVAESLYLLRTGYGVRDVPSLIEVLERYPSLPFLDSESHRFMVNAARTLLYERPRVQRTRVLELAMAHLERLTGQAGVSRAVMTGPLAWGETTLFSLEFVVAVDSPEHAHLLFPELRGHRIGQRNGCALIRGTEIENLQVAALAVPEHMFGSASYLTASSQEHRAEVLQRGRHKGWALSNLGIPGDQKPGWSSERRFCESLDLPWLPPELRRWSLGHTIPEPVIQRKDIRGDLHIHTTMTDGKATPEAMVNKALSLGYEYVAITDHTRNVAVANGMGPHQIPGYLDEIRRLGAAFPGVRILSGLEVDILEAGQLDLPDDILQQLDLVLVSIHSYFNQTVRTMMRRLEKALRNPLVHILTHPTGRVLGRRSPLPIPPTELMALLEDTGVCLELNCTENRLDPDYRILEMARDRKVPVVISTDSHRTEHMDNVQHGILQARRAALKCEDVLNSRSLPELLEHLRKRRTKPRG